MQLTGNTILITGGATGIGLVLAQELLNRGNGVIICGRRKGRLEEAQAANPGLKIPVCDVSDHNARTSLVSWLEANYPRLNILVNNAGVQHHYNFRDSNSEPTKPDEEIATNVGAPINLTTLLLPLFERQEAAAVVNVSSGLGFTPLAHPFERRRDQDVLALDVRSERLVLQTEELPIAAHYSPSHSLPFSQAPSPPDSSIWPFLSLFTRLLTYKSTWRRRPNYFSSQRISTCSGLSSK